MTKQQIKTIFEKALVNFFTELEENNVPTENVNLSLQYIDEEYGEYKI